MKLIFTLVFSTFMSVWAYAQPAQNVVNMDVGIPCTNGIPDQKSTDALNAYTSTFGMRVGSLTNNQVVLDGSNVVIHSSTGEKIVLGTLVQKPTTCGWDYDNNTYQTSVWANAKKSATVQMTLQIQPDPSSCVPYSGTVGGFLRTDHVKLQITDMKTSHTMSVNWTEQVYLGKAEFCRAQN